MSIEFQSAWETVKYPEGEDALSMAFRHWSRCKQNMGIDLEQLAPKLILIVNCMASVANYIAANDEENRFYFASRIFAKYMKVNGIDVSHATISSAKRKFVAMGYFRKVKQHTTAETDTFELTDKFKSSYKLQSN